MTSRARSFLNESLAGCGEKPLVLEGLLWLSSLEDISPSGRQHHTIERGETFSRMHSTIGRSVATHLRAWANAARARALELLSEARKLSGRVEREATTTGQRTVVRFAPGLLSDPILEFFTKW